TLSPPFAQAHSIFEKLYANLEQVMFRGTGKTTLAKTLTVSCGEYDELPGHLALRARERSQRCRGSEAVYREREFFNILN
ncbi:MAG: hypothetical protein PHU14_14665, partial [Methylovulum sp.]|nr:hypothetical protein [Methylovulum sp.]